MTQRIVGVLELASKYRYGLTTHGVPLYLFRPYDDTGVASEYIIGSKSRDTSHNQIALVDIPDAAAQPLPAPPAKPRGALVRLIGPVGDPAAEREALLLHYCPARHKTVTTTSPDPDTSDDARRVEIAPATGWITFHVDPAGCRDIDDAIAYNPTTDTLAITIADAAAAIPAGSATDETARAIGSTFYDLEGRAVIPMLPPHISEDSASLLPGQRRRGLSLIVPPATTSYFAPSWITVEHSFTYDNFIGSNVAKRLKITDETDAHVCIEKYMVYYNRVAAEFLAAAGAGVLRVQSPATAEKVAMWPSALAHLAKEAANYAPSTDITGHTGLGLTHYTHATSPLRRYADLVNQRAILGILRNPAAAAPAPVPPAIIDAMNQRAKANKRWTRDLTFLTHVTPGRVHEVDVVWTDPEGRRAWIPIWGRLIRVRHDPPAGTAPGDIGRIQIFCDPTKRNWKQRVLTAAVTDT